MNTATAIKFSPINIEQRKKIDIRAGDTVKVWSRITEGDKTRLQAFEGMVIARKHGAEPGATFTVRRVSGGYGVERVFPLYSPSIEKIELVRRSKVRRAKLYYIREKAAKAIRKKMKQMKMEGSMLLEKEVEKPADADETPTEEAISEPQEVEEIKTEEASETKDNQADTETNEEVKKEESASEENAK